LPEIDKATILIRNYNGKDLLANLLPGLISVVEERGQGDEILVVDDGSMDGSAEFVATEHPDVRLEKISPNSGNSIIPVNVGVKASANDVVICLDNDVLVESDFITPMLNHFTAEDVFSVCPKIVNPNHGGTVESVNYPLFKRGRLTGILPGKIITASLPQNPVEVWYSPGNGSAYDRSKFLEMGGLDRLYRPIYFEDIDICHRAWRRGWRTIYEPRAVTYHLKHVTTKKHLRREIMFAIYRQKNFLLFSWKNILDRELFVKHLLWILLHLLSSLPKRDQVYPRALLMALSQLKEAARARRQEKNKAAIGDREIFSRLYNLHHRTASQPVEPYSDDRSKSV